MNSKIYRCGYCGIPTNKEAQPLETNCLGKAIRILETYGDYRTHKVDGFCCIEEQSRMVQVSREMAHDAGMPEIEGSWIRW